MELKNTLLSCAPNRMRTFCLQKNPIPIFLLGILVGGCASPNPKSSKNLPLQPEASDTSLQILMRQSEEIRLKQESISNQIRELNRTRIPSEDAFISVELSGNVPIPGRLQLPEGSILARALVKVGGVIASKSEVTLQITRLRADKSSFQFEIEVRILKGKSYLPDLILQDGDHIFASPQ